jgi:hypothetical protein
VEDETGEACSTYEEDKKCIQNFSFESLKETDQSEFLDVYGRIIQKLGNRIGGYGLDSIGSG